MNTNRFRKALVPLFVVAAAMGSTACPVWRTEHKVETTHKIEAHIVLDIRQVKEEAAKVEGDVRAPLETPKAESDGKPQSMIGLGAPATRALAVRSIWSIFDVSTGAYAQSPSDEEAAKGRRKARIKDIDAALSAGCLGENNKGYLEIRPCDGSADQKGAAKALAKDENADRKTIYAAIAVKQGLKADQADAVGEVFAGEIRGKLRKGQSFQVPTAEEHFKEFKESNLGKALSAAKKGDWVAVP